MAKARITGRKAKRGLTLAAVRKLALALPGVEEGTSYGTLAFKVRKKLLLRLKEDGETWVVPVDMDQRAVLIEADPDTYYLTDHYRDYPYVLFRMKKGRAEELAALLEQAWRERATKKAVAEFDAR